MNLPLIIFVFIIQISLLASIPSDEIWKKIKNYIKQGKMLVNKNKTHFIFDESNYTKLDINSTKMQALYKKQEQIFKEFKLANYIIIVDNLDEHIETITRAERRLETHLKKEFNIYRNNIFIIFLSMKSRRIAIRIGKYFLRRQFTFFRFLKIKSHLINYFRKKQYYEAWMYLINEFYSDFKYDYFILKVSLWLVIIFGGLTFVALISEELIKFCIRAFDKIEDYYNENNINSIQINNNLNNENNQNKNKKLPNDKNLKKIVNFLKEQKHNEDILDEYCTICLEKFNDNERISEDLDSVRLRLLHNNENEKIDTLICGHKFHSNCISKITQLDNDCPLCKQKKKIKYNQNVKSMIYGLQNELNNHIYSEINYYDLYLLDFNNS